MSRSRRAAARHRICRALRAHPAPLDGDFGELCSARAGRRPGGVRANPDHRAGADPDHANLATLISAGVQVDAERAATRCREARTTKPWVQARIDRQRIFYEA